jgi:glutaredoxin
VVRIPPSAEVQPGRGGAPFVEVDVAHDHAAAELAEHINGGWRLVPTLVFDDDEALVNPTVAEVHEQLARMSAAGG